MVSMFYDPIRARTIFLAALEKSDCHDRKTYLDEACQADAELRRQVELLLDAHEQTGLFLERGALVHSPTTGSTPREQLGGKIGPYKLLQQIGEGGMGVVFMAEQTHPVQRRVAIKVIKPGMDSRQVIARFEAERRRWH